MSVLTATGAPFEIIEGNALGRKMRLFRHAPSAMQTFFDAARRHGDRLFLVDGEQRLSYAEAFARIDALAAWFASEFPGQQRRPVMIAMQNRAEWMIGFVALTLAGALPVLVNSRMSGAEMRAAGEMIGATLAFADGRRKAALLDAGWPGPVIDLAAEWPAGSYAAAAPPAIAPPAPDDDAAILFTSGTTGAMKGVALTHRSLITGIMSVQLSGAMILQQIAERHGLSPQDILARQPQSANLLISPLFHVSGLSIFLGGMASGGKLVVMQRWDPAVALTLIAAERITAFSAVPTMMWDILHRAGIGGVDISSLTSIATGGQGLPLNLLSEIRKACPAALLGSGYGLTETSGAVAMAVGEDFTSRPESAGRLLDLAEIRVLDEAGGVLPVGATGEIAVRGPMVMRDYWAGGGVDGDGWFRTADIGRVDAEGYIYIVDRKKDMVISGGENIYCAEVERAISLIPEVLEVATFGVADERLGERLVAQIVVGADAVLSDAAVQAHVTRSLAAYKAPTRILFQAEPLPRTGSGKINKQILRAQWPQDEGVS